MSKANLALVKNDAAKGAPKARRGAEKNDAPPDPDVSAAHVAPDWLTGDERRVFERVAAMIEKNGETVRTSPLVVERYAVNYIRWREAEAHVRQHGAIVAAPRTGVPMHNPQLAVANAAGAVVDKLTAELGLSPNAASRIRGAAGAKKNKGRNSHYFDR